MGVHFHINVRECDELAGHVELNYITSSGTYVGCNRANNVAKRGSKDCLHADS